MGKIIMVTSGKGGVGKSSVCAGLGAALVRRGRRVLLSDMDIGLRSLDLILGIAGNTVFDWGDLLLRRFNDRQILMPVEGVSGLFVLPAPTKLENDFNIYDIRRLFKAISREFDYVLMDSPAGIGRGFDMAALPSDMAIVVATPDPICVRAAGVVGRLLDGKNIADQRLIINRFRPNPVQKGILPDVDDVIDGSSVRLIGVVPEDSNVTFCAAQGKPLFAESRAAFAFNRIAARLEGEEIVLKHLERM